jgi:hypothetical protein
MNSFSNYLDGNGAAGELSRVFAIEVTAAQGRCGHCGAVRRFAEVHIYMSGPGVVARCPACGRVLLCLVSARDRVFLDMRGIASFTFDTSQLPG